MQSIELIAAVVIYNRRCSDSVTCRQLILNQKNYPLKVIIADNSTIETDNKEFAKKNNWIYLNMNGNKGLSYAYNRVIEYVGKFKKNQIIIWLDDDTQVTGDYFSYLLDEASKKKEVSIFAPIIRGMDNVIYSPNERGFLKNKFLKSIDDNPIPELFNAINSCLAVRTDVYTNYRYDECLFMDSVDQKFCEDMCRMGIKFEKIKVEIVQDFFQRSSDLTAKKAWVRYKIRIKDFMFYVGDDWKKRWFGIIKVSAWGAQIGVKCKSPSFFIKCLGLGVLYAISLSFNSKINI